MIKPSLIHTSHRILIHQKRVIFHYRNTRLIRNHPKVPCWLIRNNPNVSWRFFSGCCLNAKRMNWDIFRDNINVGEVIAPTSNIENTGISPHSGQSLSHSGKVLWVDCLKYHWQLYINEIKYTMWHEFIRNRGRLNWYGCWRI